jgi:membrane-associated phospholipid phosphatase
VSGTRGPPTAAPGKGRGGLDVCVGSAVAFVFSARRASLGTVSAGEERIFRAVNGLSPALHIPAWLVMQAGSLPAVPVIAALTLRRQRATTLALVLDGTAVWGLCKLVKHVVKRGRPVDHLDNVMTRGAAQRGSGFPSGHTAVATTLTAVGGHLLSRPAAHVAWAIPILVGGARQYVGAHLPLDVAGGALLGLSAGTLANRVLRLGMIG